MYVDLNNYKTLKELNSLYKNILGQESNYKSANHLKSRIQALLDEAEKYIKWRFEKQEDLKDTLDFLLKRKDSDLVKALAFLMNFDNANGEEVIKHYGNIKQQEMNKEDVRGNQESTDKITALYKRYLSLSDESKSRIKNSVKNLVDEFFEEEILKDIYQIDKEQLIKFWEIIKGD